MQQERAVRTRERLVRAAARIFDEQGLAAANVQEISRLAGVSKGALYFHFASKEDLADAVRAASGHRVDSAASELLDQGVPPVHALVQLSRLAGTWLAEDVTVRAAVRLVHEQQEQARARTVPDFCDELRATAWRLLQLADDRKELREGLPLQGCAVLVTGLLFGLERLAHSDGSYERLADFSDAAWNVLLPTLSTDP